MHPQLPASGGLLPHTIPSPSLEEMEEIGKSPFGSFPVVIFEVNIWGITWFQCLPTRNLYIAKMKRLTLLFYWRNLAYMTLTEESNVA